MTTHRFIQSTFIATTVLLIGTALAWAQDRYALRSANGIGFAEFRGYDAWQLVSVSHVESGAAGCGTATSGCIKAIVANPTMINAYRDGIPANGKPVPDGAALAKIEWLPVRSDASPYDVTVAGAQTQVSFMLKDAKRFPDTDGWGYVTFDRGAAPDTFKLKTTDPKTARKLCHSCHVGGAKERDFVYTEFAKR